MRLSGNISSCLKILSLVLLVWPIKWSLFSFRWRLFPFSLPLLPLGVDKCSPFTFSLSLLLFSFTLRHPPHAFLFLSLPDLRTNHFGNIFPRIHCNLSSKVMTLDYESNKFSRVKHHFMKHFTFLTLIARVNALHFKLQPHHHRYTVSHFTCIRRSLSLFFFLPSSWHSQMPNVTQVEREH